ncbi:hypothetical protein D3C80_1791770 [compost metagenome]
MGVEIESNLAPNVFHARDPPVADEHGDFIAALDDFAAEEGRQGLQEGDGGAVEALESSLDVGRRIFEHPAAGHHGRIVRLARPAPERDVVEVFLGHGVPAVWI